MITGIKEKPDSGATRSALRIWPPMAMASVGEIFEMRGRCAERFLKSRKSLV